MYDIRTFPLSSLKKLFPQGPQFHTNSAIFSANTWITRSYFSSPENSDFLEHASTRSKNCQRVSAFLRRLLANFRGFFSRYGWNLTKFQIVVKSIYSNNTEFCDCLRKNQSIERRLTNFAEMLRLGKSKRICIPKILSGTFQQAFRCENRRL